MDGEKGRYAPGYDLPMQVGHRMMTRAARHTGKLYSASVRLYRDALRDAVELPITTRGVLYVLAQWMNTDGTNAYPRLERLAASCQLRQRAVAKHLSTAVEAGYLFRVSEGHKGRTAVYRAVIPYYRWDMDNQRLIQPNAVVEPPQRVHQDAGYDDKGCTTAQQRLHGKDAKACTSVQPYLVSTTSTTTSQSYRSGAASQTQRAERGSSNFDVDQDDPMEWVEEQANGFEPGEEAMTMTMLDAYHPQAILNKILKDRA